MDTQNTTLTAMLVGIRPILFDRYGGDNKTKLDTMDKGYRNPAGEYGIPVLNVFSMLSAANTPSVAKRFYGKQGRDVALGVLSFVNIEALDGDDPMFAPILDENGGKFTASDPRVKILNHVARLDKGIPNPKERPMIPTGWRVRFRLELQQNELVNAATLSRMMEQGGILGLGTFRPIFGRFFVKWE